MIKDIEISDESIILPESLDINLCRKVPNRGGYTLRYLKDLAKYFNIESNINKINLCQKINKELDKESSKSNSKKSQKTNIRLSKKRSSKKSRTLKNKQKLDKINDLNNLDNLNNNINN